MRNSFQDQVARFLEIVNSFSCLLIFCAFETTGEYNPDTSQKFLEAPGGGKFSNAFPLTYLDVLSADAASKPGPGQYEVAGLGQVYHFLFTNFRHKIFQCM